MVLFLCCPLSKPFLNDRNLSFISFVKDGHAFLVMIIKIGTSS